jgi:hypothetical protein
MSDVRKYTNKLLEYVEEGVLDRDIVIQACLTYMSEYEVEDMCRINEFFYPRINEFFYSDDEDEE